jgi:hypothetical protein
MKARGVPPTKARGMNAQHRPLKASRADIVAVSERLFGDWLSLPTGDHRGEWLRYFLRTLYGADYRLRGAALLGMAPCSLSACFGTGKRVSRGMLQGIEDSLPRRVRRRREELRALAEFVQAAFEREAADLARWEEVMATLKRLASEVMVSTQPIDGRTGRFVPRRQRKFPMLRDRRSGD